MAQRSMPRLPAPAGTSRGGLLRAAGLLAVAVLLFGLYLVSPFFTVGG